MLRLSILGYAESVHTHKADAGRHSQTMKKLRQLYRRRLFQTIQKPWMPAKPWLRTLVWRQERRHLLRKIAQVFWTRPYDQVLIYSALRTLTHRKAMLDSLSRRQKKAWFRRLRRLHVRPEISLGNQALAVALMLRLGRRFMSAGRFGEIDLKPVIDEVDEGLLMHYLASRRTARRAKKQALAALLGLSDRDRLAAVLVRSKQAGRWFSKNSWFFGKAAYFGLLQEHLTWGHRLSRAARMALLPDILAGEVDSLRTFKTFLDEERDPLLTALMFAQMTKEDHTAYSRNNERFWAQHPILHQADATLQDRRRLLQRPFWSRRDER